MFVEIRRPDWTITRAATLRERAWRICAPVGARRRGVITRPHRSVPDDGVVVAPEAAYGA